MWSYFTRDQINEIKSLLARTNIQYDDDLRSLLLAGLNYQFVGQMQNYGNAAYQLSGDLKALNAVERLADGTIPLEVWLENAIEQFSILDTDSVLSRRLDELTNRKSSAPPISEPARVPDVSEARKRSVQRDDMVSTTFLLAGAEAGKSVARLRVPRHDDGVRRVNEAGNSEFHLGTAWLLAPDLVVTNHHVINARMSGENNASPRDLELQAQNSAVEFDFDTSDVRREVVPAAKLEAFDATLDYAILRLKSAVPRTPLSVNDDRIEVNSESYIAVNIIQHPQGGPKKIALRNNLVYDSNFPKLRYFTDTEHGSSGSPVFNDSWQVVALHRASTFVQNELEGRVTGWVNEGVQMAAIMEDLKAKYPQLHQTLQTDGVAGQR